MVVAVVVEVVVVVAATALFLNVCGEGGSRLRAVDDGLRKR